MTLTSVTTCTHNMAATLGNAVESVLAQDTDEFEYLILDDGSEDGSWEFLRRYQSHPRVRIYRFSRRRGLTAARNFLLARCRGDYVSIVDADDCITSDKVSTHARILDAQPDVGMVWGSAVIHKDGCSTEIIPDQFPSSHWDISTEYQAAHSATTWRRSAILSVGGYDPEYELVEAVNLYLKVGDRFRQVFCDRVAAEKRIDLNNAFRTQLKTVGDALSAKLILETIRRRFGPIEGQMVERLRRRAGILSNFEKPPNS